MLWRMPEMVAPRALVFPTAGQGERSSGNEIGGGVIYITSSSCSFIYLLIYLFLCLYIYLISINFFTLLTTGRPWPCFVPTHKQVE